MAAHLSLRVLHADFALEPSVVVNDLLRKSLGVALGSFWGVGALEIGISVVFSGSRGIVSGSCGCIQS